MSDPDDLSTAPSYEELLAIATLAIRDVAALQARILQLEIMLNMDESAFNVIACLLRSSVKAHITEN